MMRLMGIFTLIPATGLLTVCFFVLFALRRLDGTDGLRRFGKVVAALLCVCAGLVIAMGLYILVTGQHPLVVALRELGGNTPQP